MKLGIHHQTKWRNSQLDSVINSVHNASTQDNDPSPLPLGVVVLPQSDHLLNIPISRVQLQIQCPSCSPIGRRDSPFSFIGRVHLDSLAIIVVYVSIRRITTTTGHTFPLAHTYTHTLAMMTTVCGCITTVTPCGIVTFVCCHTWVAFTSGTNCGRRIILQLGRMFWTIFSMIDCCRFPLCWFITEVRFYFFTVFYLLVSLFSTLFAPFAKKCKFVLDWWGVIVCCFFSIVSPCGDNFINSSN